jgi:hypothetical protein
VEPKLNPVVGRIDLPAPTLTDMRVRIRRSLMLAPSMLTATALGQRRQGRPPASHRAGGSTQPGGSASTVNFGQLIVVASDGSPVLPGKVDAGGPVPPGAERRSRMPGHSTDLFRVRD